MMKSCFYVSLLAALFELSFAEDRMPALPLPAQFPPQSEQSGEWLCSHCFSWIPCVIEKEVADGYPADSDNFVYRVLILNEVGDSTRDAPQEYYILGAYPSLDAAMDALTLLQDSRKARLNTVPKEPKRYRLLPPDVNGNLFTEEELDRLNRFALDFNTRMPL